MWTSFHGEFLSSSCLYWCHCGGFGRSQMRCTSLVCYCDSAGTWRIAHDALLESGFLERFSKSCVTGIFFGFSGPSLCVMGLVSASGWLNCRLNLHCVSLDAPTVAARNCVLETLICCTCRLHLGNTLFAAYFAHFELMRSSVHTLPIRIKR